MPAFRGGANVAGFEYMLRITATRDVQHSPSNLTGRENIVWKDAPGHRKSGLRTVYNLGYINVLDWIQFIGSMKPGRNIMREEAA